MQAIIKSSKGFQCKIFSTSVIIFNILINNLNAQTNSTITNHCFLYPTQIGKELSNSQEKRRNSYTYDVSYFENNHAIHFYKFELSIPSEEIKPWGRSYSEIRSAFFSPDNTSLFFTLVELNEIKLSEPLNILPKRFESGSQNWSYDYSKYRKYPNNNLLSLYNGMNYTTTITSLKKNGNEINSMGIYLEHTGPSVKEFSECLIERNNKCYMYCIDGSFIGLNFKFKVKEYNNNILDEKWKLVGESRSSEIFKPTDNTEDFSRNIENTFSMVNEAIDLKNQLQNNVLDRAALAENIISNLGTLFEPLNNLTNIIVDPNLKYVASTLNKKNEIYLWAISPSNPKNIKTDRPFIVLKGHESQPFFNSISPDGRFIWTSDGKRNIIWDVPNQAIIFETTEWVGDVDWNHHLVILNGPLLFNFINKSSYDLTNSLNIPGGCRYNAGFSSDGKFMYCYINKDKRTLGIATVNLYKALNREYFDIKQLIKEKFDIAITDENLKLICNNNNVDTLINYLRSSSVHKKTEFEKEVDYKKRINADLLTLKDLIVYLFESKYITNSVRISPGLKVFKNIKDGEFAQREMEWDDFKYNPDKEKLCFKFSGVVACVDMTPEMAKKFKEDKLYKKWGVFYNKTFPENQLYPNYDNLFLMYEKDGKKYNVYIEKQPLEDIMKELGIANTTKNKNISEKIVEEKTNISPNNKSQGKKSNINTTIQAKNTIKNTPTFNTKESSDEKLSITGEYWKLHSKDSSKIFSPYCYDVRLRFNDDGSGFEERVVYCNKWTISHIDFNWKTKGDILTLYKFTTLKVCDIESDPVKYPVNDYEVKYRLNKDTFEMEGEKDHNGIKWVNKNAVIKNFINYLEINDKDGNTYKTVSKPLSKRDFSSQGTSYPKGNISLQDGGKGGSFDYLQYAYKSERSVNRITKWGIVADCTGNPNISTVFEKKCYSLIVELDNGVINKFQIWLNESYLPESLLVGGTLWK